MEVALHKCKRITLGYLDNLALNATSKAVAKWYRVAAVTVVMCFGGPHRTVSASPASKRCRESGVYEAGARVVGCRENLRLLLLLGYTIIPNRCSLHICAK